MRIEVTAEHIRKGKAWSCRNCPIAKAIQEATGMKELEVAGGCLYKLNDSAPVCKLPSKALEFIASFDRGYTVGPFEFELDLPASFLAKAEPAHIPAPPAGNFEEWA